MEESDSEKKMEKENLGPRMDPPIGEPEGSLGWVLPNTAMKKKVRCVRYLKNMQVKVRSYYSANIFVVFIYHLSWTVAGTS